MSGWTDALDVEQRGQAELMPFVREKWAEAGQVVIVANGRMAEFLQKRAGDVILKDAAGRLVCLEFKIEETTTGNFFLETWSNLSRYTPGWMVTLCSDYLVYYFLDTKVMHVMTVPALKHWCFQERAIYRFPEVRQGKNRQKNDTWGRLVPIEIVRQQLGQKYRQYDLTDWRET